jgi:decaprenylphospho-beta-D-erythro-pentofuranosid-2-ulose 2-reductase
MNKAGSILILGATSAIAQAYARRRALERTAFVLVARHPERLAVVAADLVARGAASAEGVVLDLAAIDSIEASAKMLWSRFGDIDEVLIAYGILGDQNEAETNLAAARNVFDTNFTSVALWILALLNQRAAAAPITVVAIGSVAGDRGRASNFIYGSAKGGLERLLEGLAQKYDGSAVRIVMVKPGFVDTPMTSGIRKGGPLWASPDQIAADIQHAVSRGSRIVYTPWFWWPIMTIIRHLPWFLFKHLKV